MDTNLVLVFVAVVFVAYQVWFFLCVFHPEARENRALKALERVYNGKRISEREYQELVHFGFDKWAENRSGRPLKESVDLEKS